ncbi:hypothetical protein F4778DRAFT_303859 [Xylariomycetidae sp. FL2044]|nr:hypothetical protein F4778DRAFT_303859 [Xylariomycetidae sp. FL2044]
MILSIGWAYCEVAGWAGWLAESRVQGFFSFSSHRDSGSSSASIDEGVVSHYQPSQHSTCGLATPGSLSRGAWGHTQYLPKIENHSSRGLGRCCHYFVAARLLPKDIHPPSSHLGCGSDRPVDLPQLRMAGPLQHPKVPTDPILSVPTTSGSHTLCRTVPPVEADENGSSVRSTDQGRCGYTHLLLAAVLTFDRRCETHKCLFLSMPASLDCHPSVIVSDRSSRDPGSSELKGLRRRLVLRSPPFFLSHHLPA